MKHEKKWGEFCSIFGATPRNRIIELFLQIRELDYPVGDIARETGLNRATAYSVTDELVAEDTLIPTRKVSGVQLYKLNTSKKEILILIDVFNLILARIAEDEHPRKKILR